MRKLFLLIPLLLMCGKNPVAPSLQLKIPLPTTVAGMYKYISDKEAETGQYFDSIMVIFPDVEILKYFDKRVGSITNERPFLFEKRTWILIFAYPKIN